MITSSVSQKSNAQHEPCVCPKCGAVDECKTDLLAALEDIIAEYPNPKLPYGIRIVEIARAAIKKAEAQP